MMYRILISVCLSASALAAADLVERPLYAALEILPSNFHSTVTSRNGTFTGDDSVPNLGVATGIRHSFAAAGSSQGLVLGFETAVENAEFDAGSHRAAALRVAASWATAVDRAWIIRTGVRFGYGLSRLDLGIPQGNDVSATGLGIPSSRTPKSYGASASEDGCCWAQGGAVRATAIPRKGWTSTSPCVTPASVSPPQKSACSSRPSPRPMPPQHANTAGPG